MKQTIRQILLSVAMLFASLAAFSQVTTSSMSGKIQDLNEVGVAGATVIATHTPSGTQYYSIADSKGFFRILNILPGGPYTVTVEMLGFHNSVVKDINVALVRG